jgi:hypothetical protein
VDLDTDFPGQRGLILLLDDIFAYGVVFGLIIGVVILVVFYLYSRKHSQNTKI